MLPAGVMEASDGYPTNLVYKNEEFPKLCQSLDLAEVGLNSHYAINEQRVVNETEFIPAIH